MRAQLSGVSIASRPIFLKVIVFSGKVMMGARGQTQPVERSRRAVAVLVAAGLEFRFRRELSDAIVAACRCWLRCFECEFLLTA
ncbi:hypothetical protein EMEDMD4_800021 [Sinorhizobium medicae]|uniref:Uncharacterized protein n=1 Tax=Sinorhizobium medicae TaxID=110321 RepID=A0A508XB83_9HYPH|nr:hypothetical protein EMEDMD4_800021 [Sinorhizobium medicae]